MLLCYAFFLLVKYFVFNINNKNISRNQSDFFCLSTKYLVSEKAKDLKIKGHPEQNLLSMFLDLLL